MSGSDKYQPFSAPAMESRSVVNEKTVQRTIAKSKV